MTNCYWDTTFDKAFDDALDALEFEQEYSEHLRKSGFHTAPSEDAMDEMEREYLRGR